MIWMDFRGVLGRGGEEWIFKKAIMDTGLISIFPYIPSLFCGWVGMKGAGFIQLLSLTSQPSHKQESQLQPP